MAQRITPWVLSYAKGLLESFWISRSAQTAPASATHYTPTTCYIQTLPPELLNEIFKYLRWRELLNVSLTCRAWHRAFQSRQLWLHIVKNLESMVDIGPMEEPTTEYTVSELQHWVLQRLQSQEAWNIPNGPLTFKKRIIELEDLRYAILIPGGRWLLATDLSGRLYSYDLDASDLRPHLLIGPASDEPTPTEGPFKISHWVDESKRKLSFRVALWDGIPLEEKDKTLISIYQVDLLGHGEEAFLEARPLTVVKDNKNICRFGMDLTGKYVTGCRSMDHKIFQLFLLEYATAEVHDMENEDENHICVEFQTTTAKRVSQMYITPTDEILVMSPDYIDIFTVHQLQSHTSRDGILLPLHHIRCSYGQWLCTPPFTHQNCTSLIFGYQDAIHLARFASNGEAPIVTKIRDQPLHMGSDVIFGITPAAALIVHSTWDADLLSFSCDADLDSVAVVNKHVTMKIHDDFGYIYLCGIEKGIGRLAFYEEDIGSFVLDAV